jgi:hypothetical protein
LQEAGVTLNLPQPPEGREKQQKGTDERFEDPAAPEDYMEWWSYRGEHCESKQRERPDKIARLVRSKKKDARR